jgi:hypothetical protein
LSNKTLGREAIIEAGGQAYRLARFDRDVLERFLDWAETKLPNPISLIKDQLADFSPAHAEMLIKEAMSRAALKRSYNSPDVQSLLHSPLGAYKVFHLLLAKYHPELTERESRDIYDQATLEHGIDYVAKKIAVAEGQMPTPESAFERQVMVEAGVLAEKKG